jgi:hypothetical protein
MKLPAAIFLIAAFPALAALDQSLQKLATVGREGEGNEAATAAWKEVVQGGPAALLPILEATGKGGSVADNWLRLAANTIADQALAAKVSLPLVDLEHFVRDAKRAPLARVLAYDLIRQADVAKADEIEPSLLHDPSQELRRGPVQRLINEARQKAEAKAEAAAKSVYTKAFAAARDEDQVKAIVDGLEKLGEKPDVAKHFGFLMKWNIIGPFDNTGREGFAKINPPESGINLGAVYEGKSGPVKWQPFETTNEYGKVDFNKPLGVIPGGTPPAPAPEADSSAGRRRKGGGIEFLKEVVAYATTDFYSADERNAEIRIGCKNGWKVWLNGELLFGRDEYHRGAQLDQYKIKCHLKQGKNTILVKCCQNEQKEAWTVEWEFQLRVCDATGTAIVAGNP